MLPLRFGTLVFAVAVSSVPTSSGTLNGSVTPDIVQGRFVVHDVVAIVTDTRRKRDRILQEEIKPQWALALSPGVQSFDLTVKYDVAYSTPVTPDGRTIRQIGYDIAGVSDEPLDTTAALTKFHDLAVKAGLQDLWAIPDANGNMVRTSNVSRVTSTTPASPAAGRATAAPEETSFGANVTNQEHIGQPNISNGDRCGDSSRRGSARQIISDTGDRESSASGLDMIAFAQSLSRDVAAILVKLDKVMMGCTTQYKELSARVESLEKSQNAGFASASQYVFEQLHNLQVTLTDRLTPLANGLDLAARSLMKCSTKKRSKPVPVGTMKTGDALYAEEQFCSTDGQTCLHLQSNGNMVLYRTATLQVIWTSYTGVGDCRSLLKMQDDGRLGLYHYPTVVARWATPLHEGAELVFRENGHLCLKLAGTSESTDCLWSTDFIDPAWESQIYYH